MILLIMIMLFVFAIILPLIGYYLKPYSKFTAAIFIFSPLVFILVIAGWWILATNHYFVSSTNLDYEYIGEFRLQETITEKQLEALGSFTKRENEDGYSYENQGSFLSTDLKRKVVSISAYESPLETTSGLKVGDTIEKAKQIYGSHYYSYREMGLGKAVVYIDRINKHRLTIWTEDEHTVSNIWLDVY